MPASQTSIFNIALVALGEEPLVVATGRTKPERLMLARWDASRRYLLRRGNFNCAKARVVLAADPVAPVFGFASRYLLPTDFVKMFDLPDNDLASWSVEGGADGTASDWLLTDEGDPLNVLYFRDVTDPEQFDGIFEEAMGYRLAAEVAPSITQSRSKAGDMEAKLNQLIAEARLASSQENSPPEWDVDILLRSRR